MATVEDVYDAEHWQEELARIISRRYLSVLSAMHALIGDALGLDDQGGFRLDDAATRRQLERALLSTLEIDETTREAIRKTLAIGQARGYSDWQIANGVPDDGYPGIDGLYRKTWAQRPYTIARTELSRAQVAAAQDRYEQSGIVKRVEIADGDKHEPCAARNGKVVPLSSRPQLLHPMCRLQLIPIVEASS